MATEARPEAREPKAAAKVLRVTAPLVTVKDSNNAVRYLSMGDVVPEGTPAASIDHLVDLGYVSEEK